MTSEIKPIGQLLDQIASEQVTKTIEERLPLTRDKLELAHRRGEVVSVLDERLAVIAGYATVHALDRDKHGDMYGFRTDKAINTVKMLLSEREVLRKLFRVDAENLPEDGYDLSETDPHILNWIRTRPLSQEVNLSDQGSDNTDIVLTELFTSDGGVVYGDYMAKVNSPDGEQAISAYGLIIGMATCQRDGSNITMMIPRFNLGTSQVKVLKLTVSGDWWISLYNKLQNGVGGEKDKRVIDFPKGFNGKEQT